MSSEIRRRRLRSTGGESARRTSERARSVHGSDARAGRVVRVARRLLATALVAVPMVGVLLVGVYPLDAWRHQEQELRSATRRLRELERRRDELRREVEFLRSDEAVELLAREEYGLVKPGEEAYVVVEPPPPSVELPEVWPFDDLARRFESDTSGECPVAPDVPPNSEYHAARSRCAPAAVHDGE